MDLSTLYNPQAGVVTGGQRRRPSKALPYQDIVLAEVPEAIRTGEIEAQEKQRQEALEAEKTRHQENLSLTKDIHLKELQQREQQSADVIAQREKEMKQARKQAEADRMFMQEQAEKSEKIQMAGLAIQGATAVANLMGGSKVVSSTLSKISSIAKGIFSKLFG